MVDAEDGDEDDALVNRWWMVADVCYSGLIIEIEAAMDPVVVADDGGSVK